ncbi:MAG: M23 family metallopeptidase [Selenomonas sp.]|uniref:M23 family metallopeptidase n=1 Tax=Selenomonas sp. TaxID=2053611 RepID=UPI0025DB4F89|nr:M23 family metallopeptidase [Selenomonas sp.]MCR5439471.1 M23 family metallopeptidase [Selenomonas sp.]
MADEKKPEIKESPKYTIKFIPPNGGDVKKIHLSERNLKIGVASLAVGALLFVGAFSYSVYSTFAAQSGQSEIRELREVNTIQQEQLLQLSKKANDLQDEMEQLKQVENELRQMTGMAPAQDANAPAAQNPDASGNGDGKHDGQGGPVVQPDLNNIGQVLTLVEQGITQRRESLMELQQHIKDRQEKLGYNPLLGGSTTPSIWPAHGDVSSPFGLRWNGSDFHPGIDIANDAGTPILATADGVVTTAGWNDGGYGNMVDIDHGNGIMTRYGHAMQVVVTPGQYVRRGQVIAYMGSTGFSTGPHVHYEVRIGGEPVNPASYLH